MLPGCVGGCRYRYLILRPYVFRDSGIQGELGTSEYPVKDDFGNSSPLRRSSAACMNAWVLRS